MKSIEEGYQDDKMIISKFIETGNKKLLGKLYIKYHQSVFLICQKYIQNKNDALDLTQDIFIKAFDKIETLKNQTSFAAWLFQISRNFCNTFIKRKRMKNFEDIERYYGLEDIPYSNQSELEKEQLLDQIFASIPNLPKTTQEILVHKYLFDYSLKQLEQKYMLSESAVKMRLLRAKKTLKTQVEKVLLNSKTL